MNKKVGLIIGLHGKVGSGKDTVAREILKSFPEYSFKRKSFGYNVKKIVSIITGIDMRTILSRKIKTFYLKSWNMTVGEMFQKIGTNALRDAFDDDIWIKSLFNNINDDDNIIITDVRFINEAKSIKDRGGYLIKIVGDPNDVNKYDSRNKTHSSETELDDFNEFDVIYENNPPIENLSLLSGILKNKLGL